MVSNALLRSINTAIMCSFFESKSVILSNNCMIAKSVEWFFLNPNWDKVMMSLIVKKDSNLLYTIFSNIFEIAGNKEIGR